LLIFAIDLLPRFRHCFRGYRSIRSLYATDPKTGKPRNGKIAKRLKVGVSTVQRVL
jgi:hypothetical protein